MSVGSGIGLFFIGMVITVIFFMVWFHAMEQEANDKEKEKE